MLVSASVASASVAGAKARLRQAGINLGYTDVHAFVPPQVDDNKFNLTMIKMGWHKSEWPSYARNIVPVQEEAIK